jgi:hypothetical protein
MLSVKPQLTAAQLTDLLKSTSKELGAVGFDSVFGAGRVDANAAVLAALTAATSAEAPATETQPIKQTGKGKR